MAGDSVPTEPSGHPAWRPRGTESALDDILPHLLRALRREPALALSIGYLLVVGVGIFYNVSFYRKFDIPILTLSQIGDFLVAGIQQPVAIVLVLSTFPLCWVFDRWNMRYRSRLLQRSGRLRALENPSRWQRLRLRLADWSLGQPHQELFAYLLIIPLYGWAFVSMYAQHRAEAVRKGETAVVRVWLATPMDDLEQGRHYMWLGTTGSYVFVYDREAGRSVVFPVENVQRIEPLPRPARAKPSELAPKS